MASLFAFQPRRAIATTFASTLKITLTAGLLALGAATPALAAETESATARGGRLYDKFYAENKASKPTDNHPAYANKAGKYDKENSWRCKECHGWDYLGKDGAYASGSHFSGIKGVAAYAGKAPADIAAIIRNATHAYTDKHLSDRDVNDLALFISQGQPDMSRLIDAQTKKAKGDPAKGEAYFNTLCAGCHGTDGKKVKDAPALGSVADNHYEMLHKVLNGQPGEGMPALRALDHQISADIVSYLPSLPKE
ncbi:c-type cytochrome [Thauera sp.]|uniref:c-type cytochrome n=1 Tax=Thauera sp. TaxID=1905334 RepID=UPI002A3595D0|nr:c-type cytochrome [Thauera sp.]MDX9884693.1 c-type cytochrome [Thauera sp.]